MIIDTIQEWFKEVLIDGIISNLSGTFDTVNTKVAEIAGEVGMTPSGWNGGIFNMIRSLSETVIVPIAGIILTFVKRFESTSTFRRWKDRVDIPLIKIEDEDIAKLLSSVIDAVTIISNLYLKEYYQRRNRVIANYYFNKENAYDFFADTE